MDILRITGVQMRVKPSKAENKPRIINLIERCDSEFIVFPAMSLTGYNNDFSDSRTAEAWKEISTACRKSYTTALVGTGARSEGHTFIQTRIFGDDGKVLGTHEKLVPTEEDRSWVRAGEELRTFSVGELSFGCLIGNDLWVAPGFGPYHDPRLSYQLGQKGTRVIFHSACTGTDPAYSEYYESNLRLRAREANAYIVTINTTPEDGGTLNVPSGVMGPEGEWRYKAEPTGEHTFVYDLEIED